MKKFASLLAVGMLMAAPAYAQVAGKWTGEQPGRQGNPPTPVVLEIKKDGTGTMTSGTQPGVALAEGKVTGNNVEFKISREIQGQTRQIGYKGEVKGDELSLTMEMGGGGAGAAPAGGAAAGGAAAGGGQPRPPLVLKRSK